MMELKYGPMSRFRIVLLDRATGSERTMFASTPDEADQRAAKMLKELQERFQLGISEMMKDVK